MNLSGDLKPNLDDFNRICEQDLTHSAAAPRHDLSPQWKISVKGQFVSQKIVGRQLNGLLRGDTYKGSQTIIT